MKNLIFTLILLFVALIINAQSPEAISYQAIVRNTSGQVLPNADVSLRISILAGSNIGDAVYIEKHNITTNQFGLITIKIGKGTLLSGSFSTIDWATNFYYTKVEIDITGGTNFQEIGISEMLSVPYALYAKRAGNGFSGSYLDLTNKPVLFDWQFNSLIGKPNLSAVATTGNYSDLINKPAFDGSWSSISGRPTTIVGFGITDAFDGTWASLTGKPTFANVAISGSYLDLTNKPAFDGSWSSISGRPTTIVGFGITDAFDGTWASLTGKPTFANVAISGSFADLLNKPTTIAGYGITDAFNGTWSSLTGKPAGTNIGDMLYWNGTNWVVLPRGTNGQVLTTNGANIPTWQTALLTPTVSTQTATNVQQFSATSGGTTISENGNVILTKGVCWSTSHNPTTSNQYTSDGVGTQSYTSILTNLTPNKLYYVRAYVTTVAGTGYGLEISFTTNPLSLASLVTGVAYNISNTSATADVNITSDGGASVTARGLCWSNATNPTIANSTTTEETGIGTFTSTMTGLTQGETYYVRAYATNSVGTSYGNQISFTSTIIPLATITTTTPGTITYTGASSGGEVTNDGGSTVTAKGVCYGTSTNPTIANSVVSAGSGLGSFVSIINGLIPNTTYYLRAFATNTGGTKYGTQYNFTTLALKPPVLSTKNITGISAYSANGGGDITDDGGSYITTRGICWNTIGTPTISGNKTIDGTGPGIFNSILTGLSLNTTYYVRAYATNSNGTSYGQQVNFTTPATIPPANGLPVLGTKTVAISSSSYNTGGYISSDGGSTVTQRGVCWGTNINPTISDNFTTDGVGIGLFNSVILSLSGCGTTYYIRAYAMNSTGTGYGNQVSVSSGLLPLVAITTTLSDITLTSATSGGNITSEGSCSITERGVCWNTLPNPTINNFKSKSGIGIGNFSTSLSNLYPNTTYYARAYATSIAGTGYGPEIQFITQAGTTGLALGQFYAGGLIFYLDNTGNHGLVCSQVDIGFVPWGCYGTSIPGTNEILGSGAENTANILANCSESGIAARLCDELLLNEYSDWFLPSKDELNLIYLNLHLHGVGSFSNLYYWSSSEAGPDVWYHNFDSGNQFYTGSKYIPNYVRAVRAF